MEIFHKNGLFVDIPDLDVYQCIGCKQGYWWSDRPNSSASRIKNAVSYLFHLAIDYGIPYSTNGISDEDIIHFLTVDEDQEDGLIKEKKKMGNINKDILSQVLRWLHDDALKHSICTLTSAYHNKEANKEEIEFTNVTDGFIGILDYIFYESKYWNCGYRLDVPMTFENMNYDGMDEYNSHCIPNDMWPSDHLAIGCLLVQK